MGPQRIVRLTKETPAWLGLAGEERRIVGSGGYALRPRGVAAPTAWAATQARAVKLRDDAAATDGLE